MKYYSSKSLHNETGFTLIEVLLATVILAILSLPIFYSSLQAANNYKSAEKYYEATLDAENIITEIKAALDTKIKDFSGKNIDLDFKFSTNVVKTKNSIIPIELESADGQSFITDIAGLGLDKAKFSYEVYLKKLGASVNITKIQDKTSEGIYKFKYGPNLTSEDIPMKISGSNFVVGSSVGMDSAVWTKGGDTLVVEYVVAATTTIAGPINISTYDMDPSAIAGATKVKMVVRNYSTSKVDINLFTDLIHDPKKDILVTYDSAAITAGAIHVLTNKGVVVPIPEYSYAIVVAVTDNTRGNKILVQLTDVYSYVPK